MVTFFTITCPRVRRLRISREDIPLYIRYLPVLMVVLPDTFASTRKKVSLVTRFRAFRFSAVSLRVVPLSMRMISPDMNPGGLLKYQVMPPVNTRPARARITPVSMSLNAVECFRITCIPRKKQVFLLLAEKPNQAQVEYFVNSIWYNYLLTFCKR